MLAATFRTEGRHGYAVEFSPYFPQRLACASSQHFGIAGAGTLFITDITPEGPKLVNTYDWKEGLFDVTWSEINDNICVTGSGDGSIQVWDTTQPKGPVKAMKGHTKEVYGVNWSLSRGEPFVLSASWDNTVKLWDISQSSCLSTYSGHDHVVYSAVWSPHNKGAFASASGDQTLRVWDVRKNYMPQMVIPAHTAEIVTCDWCKYDNFMVVTGATDGSIRGWDLRRYTQPVFECHGHQYAIRRLKCSPFQCGPFITSSYDFTVRTWNPKVQLNPIETIEHHTEFVCGVDYNIHVPGQIADCSWDQTVKVYSPASCQNTAFPGPGNEKGCTGCH